MSDDTIVAIASPKGLGAIAVVRVSGKDSWKIGRKVIDRLPPEIKPWQMLHAFIREPESIEAIDEVLVCFMKAPSSYTGEDMLEIYCHGGLLPPQTILEVFLKQGSRQAKAGEFTRRAMEHGKMDLVQAEFVQQMAQAQSSKELQLSLKNIKGHLSEYIQQLIDGIQSYLVWAEAIISFPDHIDMDMPILPLLETWQNTLNYLCDQYERSQILVSGFHLAIIGKTNVGKSTLFNSLADKNRSLVSPYASTTHDYIEELLIWSGNPIHLYDTAGWVDEPEPIDKLCLEQTHDIIQKSSLILAVVDVSDPKTMDLQYMQDILKHYSHKTWIIINKSDLKQELPESWLNIIPSNIPMYSISAITKTGLDQLKKEILTYLPLDKITDLKCLVNQRWYQVFQQAQLSFQHISDMKDPDMFLDMIIAELKQIQLLLKEQLGYNLNEELYRQIFDRFCIGK
jgi:tRNA modification GTPase